MKALFLSSNLLNHKNGGWQCSNRNLESIRDLTVTTEVFHIKPNSTKGIKSFLLGFYNLLCFRSGGITSTIIREVLKTMEDNRFDVVFIDSSVFGQMAKAIKINFPNITVISFYHNVEFDFVKKLICTGGLLHFFRLPSCFLNEYLTTKWSDKLIVLTDEDRVLIKRLYFRKKDNKPIYVIPISFKAAKSNPLGIDLYNDNRKKLLFVGSYFYANVQGIKWFIKNVKLPTDVTLIIVGKNMDKLYPMVEKLENIDIHSDVDDLSVFYALANAVICPLFFGGGMKVKVAEALMYGKKIIGTELAFYGYNAEDCDTMIEVTKASEFLLEIEKLKVENKLFVDSEDHFNNFFSYDSTLELFRSVFKVE